MDWQQAWTYPWHLAAAYAPALPVAFDREASSRSAGLRTFPPVAIAACGYTRVGLSVLGSTDADQGIL